MKVSLRQMLITQYKEQQEKALPKFKYYAKLMAELKKTLDEEVKPLLNH